MIITSIFAILLSGALDGLLEAYTIGGRKFFENVWNVRPVSYLGSKSWLLAYKDNDESKGFKSKYREWMGARDFYHHADRLRGALYMILGLLVGIIYYTQYKEINLWLLLFGAYLLKSIPKSLAFSYVRRVDKNLKNK